MGLKLTGEVSLDGSGFSRGLTGLGNQVGALKNTLVAAFGAFAIGNLVKGTVAWAGALQDSADALGVNVEFLQKLQNGAKLSGADIEDVTKFMLEMNKSREDAFQKPTDKNAQAFGRLGVSRTDITSLNTQQFFEKIMAAFANGATTQSVTDLQEVGGRSARKLAAAFANQFASDAPIVAKEIIAQLDQVGDRFSELQTTLMVTLAPAILWVIEKIREFVNTIKQLGAFFGGMFRHTVEKGFSGEAGNAFAAGGQDATEEEQRQKAEKRKSDAAIAAVVAARKKREEEVPKFPDLLTKDEKPTSATQSRGLPSSDALLAVGNFLGSGSSAINSIASQQLKEAQTTNAKLDKANTTLQTIATMFPKAGFFGGIDVP